jgi:hypothetical protein
MNGKEIKKGLEILEACIPFPYPAMCWYFTDDPGEDALAFKKDKWVCMFMYLKLTAKTGRPLSFSKDRGETCVGAAEYFGFRPIPEDSGWFLADDEHFKKSRTLAEDYRREARERVHPPKAPWLCMAPKARVRDEETVEVVNLFPDAAGLTALSAFAAYDREENSGNVRIPCASGCQSLFTLPYDQGFRELPYAVAGLSDPFARNFIPKDMMTFSLPAGRFLEMVNNIPGSFLDPAHSGSTVGYNPESP